MLAQVRHVDGRVVAIDEPLQLGRREETQPARGDDVIEAVDEGLALRRQLPVRVRVGVGVRVRVRVRARVRVRVRVRG